VTFNVKLPPPRTRLAAALAEQVGLLADPKATPLAMYFEPPQHNLRGVVTGKIQPVFDLRAT
jgi:hypothetical protein